MNHCMTSFTNVLQDVVRYFVPKDKLVPLTTAGAAVHPDFPSTKSPCLLYILDPSGPKNKTDTYQQTKGESIDSGT